MILRRLLWLSLALMFAGAAAIFLWTGPALDAATGGLAPPETRPGGYTAEEAGLYLAALGEVGRATYLGAQRVADTVFPIGFAATLALGIYLSFRRCSRVLAAIMALPAPVYFAFDMLENARFAALLRGWPAFDPALAARASTATVAKFAFVDLSLVLVALGLLTCGIARLRRRA